jgi:cobyrinic acid a,c-diamide synthase
MTDTNAHEGARAVLIAAISSNQGKTTITTALARRLTRMGKRVRVFKCGPDFIDSMLLECGCGSPAYNLDLWLLGPDECRRRLDEAAREADAILVEGIMGLYDGSPSAADLARQFGMPVVAVFDASVMAQTAGAVALGLRDYGPVQLIGMVANRIVSPAHEALVKGSLRDIPLVGMLPRQEKPLPNLHLGLTSDDEYQELHRIIDTLADQIEFDEQAWNALPVLKPSGAPAANIPPLLTGRTIAIARDASFVFVYPGNTELLQRLGARLVYFAPMADEAVPDDADAVYLPGGYPELHGPALEAASRWRASIRAAHQRGVPIVAECGGMMAIVDGLTDKQGKRWEMAGLLPGEVIMQSHLASRGGHIMPTAHGDIRGHINHFSVMHSTVPADTHIIRHFDGATGEPVYRQGSLTASYFHGYFPSNPVAAAAMFTGAAG